MGLGLHDSEACAPDHHTPLPTHGETAFQLGETDYQCAPRKPVRNGIAKATQFYLLTGIQFRKSKDLNTKNTKFQSQVSPQLSVSLCAGEATSFRAQFDHHKKNDRSVQHTPVLLVLTVQSLWY